jgi:hypothetical protein
LAKLHRSLRARRAGRLLAARYAHGRARWLEQGAAARLSWQAFAGCHAGQAGTDSRAGSTRAFSRGWSTERSGTRTAARRERERPRRARREQEGDARDERPSHWASSVARVGVDRPRRLAVICSIASVARVACVHWRGILGTAVWERVARLKAAHGERLRGCAARLVRAALGGHGAKLHLPPVHGAWANPTLGKELFVATRLTWQAGRRTRALEVERYSPIRGSRIEGDASILKRSGRRRATARSERRDACRNRRRGGQPRAGGARRKRARRAQRKRARGRSRAAEGARGLRGLDVS